MPHSLTGAQSLPRHWDVLEATADELRAYVDRRLETTWKAPEEPEWFRLAFSQSWGHVFAEAELHIG
jgi:hypothetical protein